jgi:TM2 domain-containing membrane protein YozV
MEKQLYIRIRGRVLGPYNQDKLQSLARHGQLSRLHELSTDGTSWGRASAYPELFVNQERQAVLTEEQVVLEVQKSVAKDGPPQMLSGQRWWYGKNGSESGPVDYATIQQLLVSGNLSPDDVVWTDGMTQWVPARHAPGLTPFVTPPSPPSSPQPLGGNGKFCHHCAARIASLAEICPKCGVRQAEMPGWGGHPAAGPSKVVACLLALFLGCLGVHKFYLGQTAWGVIYLLAFVFFFWTIFVPVIISVVCLVEGIAYLTYNDADFSRKYGRGKTG